MKTIIFPGYSPRNKEWGEKLKESLSLGHKVILHEWMHWQGGSMSVTKELEKIVTEVGGEELIIIAKSVGTRVCMKFLLRKTNKVEKIILCGIPTVSEENGRLFRQALENFPPKNITVFQNRKDPFATFKEVKEFIGKVNPEIAVVEKPAGTHDYPYFEDFSSFLK